MTAEDVSHEPRTCAVALSRAFEFLGKRWNGVLLGVLLDGPAGYAEIKRAVAGISDSMLSERLAELTRAGLFERLVDAGPPVSVTYQLTASGRALAPAFEAITTWAQENLTESRCAEERARQQS
jgi:DNA-binding HxlR family transcriptional regulator